MMNSHMIAFTKSISFACAITLFTTSLFAADLTTYQSSGPAISRYIVNLGRSEGDTAKSGTSTDGIMDYPKYRGNQNPWYVMNDGDTSSGQAATFYDGDPGAHNDFFGYIFKTAADVESLNFQDYSFGDGGPFTNDTPVVQVLTGSRAGTWTTVSASWSPSYDNTFLNGRSNPYTITLDSTATDVWGVRLYGGGNPIAADPSGFVACRELRVNGSAFDGIDLSQNMAQEAGTSLHMIHEQNGNGANVIDDDFSSGNFETTFGAGNQGTDYIGVTWSSSQSDIAAVGWTFRTFGDGGWFEQYSIDVEYATITGGVTNWTSVSGLDTSVYDSMIGSIVALPDNFDTGFLFTFTKVASADGIRITGNPGGTADTDGFVSAVEFEAFKEPPALPPYPPVLSLPADDDTTSDTTPTFVWEAAELRDGSSITEYELVIGSTTNTGLSVTNYTIATPLSYGVYEWKVRAKDDNNNWSGYSTPFTLTVMPVLNGVDLTTYQSSGFALSRYIVNLGRSEGNSARGTTTGIMDFPKSAGNDGAWYLMNDGNTASGQANTFYHSDPGADEEFFGYIFKTPANIESLNLQDYSYGDGGVFTNDTPVVQVLTGSRAGTWTTVPASWFPDYDNSFSDTRSNPYLIVLDATYTNAWGVRIYGGGNPMADPSGFVACRELRVNGYALSDLNFGTNLTQIAGTWLVMTHQQYNNGEVLDNDFSSGNFDTTAGAGNQGTDYIGVRWSAPQQQINAVAWTFRTFTDGGWFEKYSIDVEYLDPADDTWKSVSNLDKSVYDSMIDDIVAISDPFDTCFLFTFDEVASADGIRIIGNPGGTADDDGFVSAVEFEVFSDLGAPASYSNDEDINACLIERFPKIEYVTNSTDPTTEGWPSVGSDVYWRAKVKNWFTGTYTDVTYAWLWNGEVLETGTVDLAPQAYTTIDTTQTWSFDRNELTFCIDYDNDIAEFSEKNNSIFSYTDAIAVGFWVEQDVYDYFHDYQKDLDIGANSWEDWAQRQVRRWNVIFDKAIYPDSPNGVLTKYRLDQIHVVPNAALPLSGGLPGNSPDRTNKTIDLQWGFDTNRLSNAGYRDHTTISDNNQFYFESALFHEIGHARYLIDTYGFNFHYHESSPNILITEGGNPIVGTKYMPRLPNWYDLVYTPTDLPTDPGYGLMGRPYTLVDRYSTMALNLIDGHRAVDGTYNSPGNIGVFLQDLPTNNYITLYDSFGNTLPNATVSVYQTDSQAGVWYGKTTDDTVDHTFYADASGVVNLGRCPFDDDGTLEHTYNRGNGTMIVRVEKGDVGFACIDAMGFNMEFWRGNTAHAYHDLYVNMIGSSYGIDGVRPVTGYTTELYNVRVSVVIGGSTATDWVTIDGGSATYNHGAWRRDVSLSTGANTIPIVAKPSGGSQVSTSVTYYRIDNNPPEVGGDALVQPYPGEQLYVNTSKRIKWLTHRMNDIADGTTLSLDSLDLVVASNGFLIENITSSASNNGYYDWTPTVTVPSDLPVALRFIMSDQSGNTTTQVFDNDFFYVIPEPTVFTLLITTLLLSLRK